MFYIQVKFILRTNKSEQINGDDIRNLYASVMWLKSGLRVQVPSWFFFKVKFSFLIRSLFCIVIRMYDSNSYDSNLIISIIVPTIFCLFEEWQIFFLDLQSCAVFYLSMNYRQPIIRVFGLLERLLVVWPSSI